MNMDALGLTDAAKTYTLDQFIKAQSTDDITYYNFSILEKYGNIEHLDHNLIEDYLPELLALAEEVELEGQEYTRYCRKPDLLAYYVYGSTQMDTFILMMNDMIDPKDFVNKKIKLVKRSLFVKFLSEVFSAETKYLDFNREQVWNN